MKLLLVFALFGISCCIAVPTCSRDEIRKCFEGPPHSRNSEEDELNYVCKYTKCEVELYDRCGPKIFGPPGYFPAKGFRKLCDTICVKSNPLRKEYLQNVGCIREVTSDFKGLLDRCHIKEEPKEQFCQDIPAGFKCAVDYVKSKCGKKAGDVFNVAARPGIDIYDCMEG